MQEDIEGMFKILESLADQNYGKIDLSKIDLNLQWLDENKNSWKKIDKETGEIDKVFTANKKKVIDKLRQTFRLITFELKDKGVIEKLYKDPGQAMGNFSDA